MPNVASRRNAQVVRRARDRRENSDSEDFSGRYEGDSESVPPGSWPIRGYPGVSIRCFMPGP